MATHGESSEQVIRLISHDLCSLLTAVQLNAQLIEQAAARGGRDKEQGWAILIVKAARRMSDMLTKLVEAESIHAGRTPLTLESVPLGELVRGLFAQRDAEVAPERVRVTLPEEPLLVRVDRRRMAQVLLSLLGLVAARCPAPREVHVEVRVKDGEVSCAIGALPPAEVGGEAAPAGPASAATGGLAVTLHLARSLIASHGGRLEVEKRAESVVAFEMVLPLA